MRILLVNPSCLEESGRDLYAAHIVGPLFTLQANTKMAFGVPLALPTLAAHTPPEHAVTIVDEEIETLDFDAPVDLVGITAMTFKARRAYAIAREFRARGVRVIMGGIHATMCPDEVAAHVDCVVVGEADDLWPKILADAAAGRLLGRYAAEGFPDLRNSRAPRYELVRNRSYLYSYLQTTRGCPFDCNFCTVTKTNGRKVRKKTPQQVIAEVEALVSQAPKRPLNLRDRATGRKGKLVGTIAFIDDNFAIDRAHALAVCAALTRYQKERNIVILWYTQVNVEVGFDPELLSALREANCQHLFIGFESLDPATLKAMKKGINAPEKYQEAVRNIHRQGIRVVFSTIIGDDNTSPDSAHRLTEFIRNNSLLHVLLNILTPYPGTELAGEMAGGGRILTRDSQRYNIRNVVFAPKGMSPADLQELYHAVCDRIFRYDDVYQRGKGLLQLCDRFTFPLKERVIVWLGLSCLSLLFAWRRVLPWGVAARLLLAAPLLILGNGSLFALELLATSADSDDFARSESRRSKGGAHGKDSRDHLPGELIEHSLRTFPLDRTAGRRIKEYKAFYLSDELLAEHGIDVATRDAKRPLLLLGGTSIPIATRKELLIFLLEAGYEIATIENPIGGLFDIGINPKKERPESLRDFLDYLIESGRVEQIDIVAQSYSAFEVIRVLLENPDRYKNYVKRIILINPPGLNDKTGPVGHSFRFIWHHVLKGYGEAMGALFGPDRYWLHKVRPTREFVEREVHGISSWSLKTFKNPVRTVKELLDIVAYRIKEPLSILQREYGYDINLFLQSGDQIVPTQATLDQISGVIPSGKVRIVAGGHNDLFFQRWQRKALLDFINEIRGRAQTVKGDG